MVLSIQPLLQEKVAENEMASHAMQVQCHNSYLCRGMFDVWAEMGVISRGLTQELKDTAPR